MTQLPLSFEERGKTVQAVRKILTGRWLPPHVVNEMLRDAGFNVSAEATTARIRDLRKPQYGGFTVNKKWNGTHFDYSVVETR